MDGIPILRNHCLILPNRISAVARLPQFPVILGREYRDFIREKHQQQSRLGAGPTA